MSSKKKKTWTTALGPPPFQQTAFVTPRESEVPTTALESQAGYLKKVQTAQK